MNEKKDPAKALGYFNRALEPVWQPSVLRNAELAHSALTRQTRGKNPTIQAGTHEH